MKLRADIKDAKHLPIDCPQPAAQPTRPQASVGQGW
jgi:hypothetical protein